ncbi:DUF6507 family protein [Streptomyces sp. NBC_01304]|uniref:DUF6507 family protein n=1 Tax=Streptomyces sp. NBC_01304 TaxID=2903818 RepID=UPI002E13A246|nr:DUF6507 family protein [Streptomyces sp. NBC_01304]
MTRWDIQPLGVQGSLSVTKQGAEQLEKAAGDLLKHLASAAANAGTVVPGSAHFDFTGPVAPGQARPGSPMGPIAVALSRWMENRRPKLEFMATRTLNSYKGAVEAVNAYSQGNLEQAANAQSEAVRAPRMPDMPQGPGLYQPPAAGGQGATK